MAARRHASSDSWLRFVIQNGNTKFFFSLYIYTLLSRFERSGLLLWWQLFWFTLLWWNNIFGTYFRITHWSRDKMAAIVQTIFSDEFFWMKIYEFRLRFHWNLFLRVQLTISQHWFRSWLSANQATSHYLNQWWLDYWRIYASLGLNEIIESLNKICENVADNLISLSTRIQLFVCNLLGKDDVVEISQNYIWMAKHCPAGQHYGITVTKQWPRWHLKSSAFG